MNYLSFLHCKIKKVWTLTPIQKYSFQLCIYFFIYFLLLASPGNWNHLYLTGKMKKKSEKLFLFYSYKVFSRQIIPFLSLTTKKKDCFFMPIYWRFGDFLFVFFVFSFVVWFAFLHPDLKMQVFRWLKLFCINYLGCILNVLYNSDKTQWNSTLKIPVFLHT